MVDAVRRATGVRRVGHAGTLDPFATGLLALLIGRATRLAPYLVTLPKTYTGTIRLGITTATDDPEGEIVSTSHDWRDLDEQAVRAAMASVTGPIAQIPPAYSAKKIAGTPAHRRVRRGESVALSASPVTVHRFELVERRGADLGFQATVGSGTYIRALARDVGAALGCGAHLSALRRIGLGPFRVEDAVGLKALRAGAATVRPPLDALVHLPAVRLDGAEREAVRHGRPVPAGADIAGPAALVAGEALVAVAERRDDCWQPRVVLEDR